MPLRAGTDLNIFETAGAMREAARVIAVARLRQAIERRGRALLLASGGSTPLPFYEAMAQEDLDWSRVTVAIVDERWVPADHEASNERAIRRSLLHDRAETTQFVGLRSAHASPAEALPVLQRQLETLPWPADVAILGMGPDGHTASWFPNAQGLAEAIDLETTALCAGVVAHESRVTGAHVARMTMTAPPVLGAGLILLLMTGEEKRAAFARARASGPVEDMPVRTLFLGELAKLYCCWAP